MTTARDWQPGFTMSKATRASGQSGESPGVNRIWFLATPDESDGVIDHSFSRPWLSQTACHRQRGVRGPRADDTAGRRVEDIVAAICTDCQVAGAREAADGRDRSPPRSDRANTHDRGRPSCAWLTDCAVLASGGGSSTFRTRRTGSSGNEPSDLVPDDYPTTITVAKTRNRAVSGSPARAVTG